MRLRSNGNFVEWYGQDIWRQLQPYKNWRKRQKLLILGDRDEIRNRHLHVRRNLEPRDHYNEKLRLRPDNCLCRNSVCRLCTQVPLLQRGEGRDCRVVYSVHSAACEYEYQVTPRTVLAPGAGAICCLPPPTTPTFTRQLMCYETLCILRAVCGPRAVFETSCVLKMQ
jgi:hypothetical protein